MGRRVAIECLLAATVLVSCCRRSSTQTDPRLVVEFLAGYRASECAVADVAPHALSTFSNDNIWLSGTGVATRVFVDDGSQRVLSHSFSPQAGLQLEAGYDSPTLKSGATFAEVGTGQAYQLAMAYDDFTTVPVFAGAELNALRCLSADGASVTATLRLSSPFRMSTARFNVFAGWGAVAFLDADDTWRHVALAGGCHDNATLAVTSLGAGPADMFARWGSSCRTSAGLGVLEWDGAHHSALYPCANASAAGATVCRRRLPAGEETMPFPDLQLSASVSVCSLTLSPSLWTWFWRGADGDAEGGVEAPLFACPAVFAYAGSDALLSRPPPSPPSPPPSPPSPPPAPRPPFTMSDVLPGRLQIQSLSSFNEQACAEVDMSDYVDTHGGGLWIGSVQDDAQTVYYEGVERVVRYSFNSRTGLQFESEFARFGYSTAAGEAGTRRFDAVVSDVRDGQMYQLVQRGEGGASSPARAAGDAFTHLVCVSQDGVETAAVPLSAPQRMHRDVWNVYAGWGMAAFLDSNDDWMLLPLDGCHIDGHVIEVVRLGHNFGDPLSHAQCWGGAEHGVLEYDGVLFHALYPCSLYGPGRPGVLCRRGVPYGGEAEAFAGVQVDTQACSLALSARTWTWFFHNHSEGGAGGDSAHRLRACPAVLALAGGSDLLSLPPPSPPAPPPASPSPPPAPRPRVDTRYSDGRLVVSSLSADLEWCSIVDTQQYIVNEGGMVWTNGTGADTKVFYEGSAHIVAYTLNASNELEYEEHFPSVTNYNKVFGSVFTDVGSGQVYQLVHIVNIVENGRIYSSLEIPSNYQGNFSALKCTQLDGTVATMMLSSPQRMAKRGTRSLYNTYAGWGKMAFLDNNDNWQLINLDACTDGNIAEVTLLGSNFQNPLNQEECLKQHQGGILEFNGLQHSILYPCTLSPPGDGPTICRRNIPYGEETNAFPGLSLGSKSDICSLAVSPSLGLWFWQSENSYGRLEPLMACPMTVSMQGAPPAPRLPPPPISSPPPTPSSIVTSEEDASDRIASTSWGGLFFVGVATMHFLFSQ